VGDSNYMTSLEDREKQNTKQEPVILKVDVIHNQEPRMQEERCGYESLGVRIWHSTNKPDDRMSVRDTLGTDSLYLSRTAARTSSVRMTVVLWYAMTLQAE